MNRFESIEIQGFRRLKDVKLKLGPLNVLIGANGSGKTSLLDVFLFLSDSVTQSFGAAISDIGGLVSNLTNLSSVKGNRAESLSFLIRITVTDGYPLEYGVVCEPLGVGYRITSEKLSQVRNEFSKVPFAEVQNGRAEFYRRGPNAEPLGGGSHPSSGTDSILTRTVTESVLAKMLSDSPEAEAYKAHLSSVTHFQVLDVSRRAPIRLPQQLRPATVPSHDADNLTSCLYSMRETDPDAFDAIEATLRAGFPNFERLGFPPVAAGMLAMTWKDKTSSQPFYMHQLSEGTLRFLWLVTLLHSPGLTAVTMIDEPEVSLHPELLALLADLFREASQRTQLIVATHSDRLIRFLKPEEVVAIDVNDDGSAKFTRGDELDLDKWLEDYSLDELWSMGRLGGRS